VVVFVDGDFWHGWRFPQWKDKLTIEWEEKIANNRARDQRNTRCLRQRGWQVLRIWEHQIHGNLDQSVRRVLVALGSTA
jgi:DNA mismatch endonuclease (patch repair protein)